MTDLTRLPTYDDDGNLRVVVETPRGARAKLRYRFLDGVGGFFEYGRPLVLGVAYAYDFGFVPQTCAPDGDPLDALVFHDAGSYPGVVIASRPIGVVRVTQKAESGDGREANDRLIVVPAHAAWPRSSAELAERVRAELQQFFELVVLMTGKDARVEGWDGAEAARCLVEDAKRAWRA